MERTANISQMAERDMEEFETNCGFCICDYLWFTSTFDRISGNHRLEGRLDRKEILEFLELRRVLDEGSSTPALRISSFRPLSRRISAP